MALSADGMRISFDLDDTLICLKGTVPSEPNRVPRLLRGLFGEPLRLGFPRLAAELEFTLSITREGCSISTERPLASSRWQNLVVEMTSGGKQFMRDV